MRCLIVVAMFAAGALTMPASASALPRDASPPSADYILALRTANSFLTAWATRDYDTGVALMSRALCHGDGDSQGQHEADLRQLVTGLSNPSHQAFLIGAGFQRLPDRFVFPVSLFELYLNADHGNSWADTLEVVRDGDEWRVDRIPRGGDSALR